MRASIKFEHTAKGLVGSAKVNGILFLSRGEDKKVIKAEIKQAVKEFIN